METDWQHAMQDQEHQQWLSDEAAQREYASWLDLLNELNAKERNDHGTHSNG